MKVMVLIKKELIKDAQMYKKNGLIEPFAEENERHWVDVGGSLCVAIKEVDSEREAVAQIAKLYEIDSTILETHVLAN